VAIFPAEKFFLNVLINFNLRNSSSSGRCGVCYADCCCRDLSRESILLDVKEFCDKRTVLYCSISLQVMVNRL